MKETLAIAIIAILWLLMFSAVPPKVIQAIGPQASPSTAGTQAQSGKFDGGTVTAVVQTNDGGYALAGSSYWFNGTFLFTDFWLVKTDSLGKMQWNQSYDSGGDSQATTLVQTSDGGYAIAGITNSNLFIIPASGDEAWLVKTDPSGNIQWSQKYGGPIEDEVCSLIQTKDGGYALAGYTKSFSGGNFTFWLVKTDSSGIMQWQETYGGTGSAEARSVIQTADGGYAIAGSADFGSGNDQGWLVKTDASGNTLWNQTYPSEDIGEIYSVIQASDGSYALAGWLEAASGNGRYGNGWLVKTDSAGNFEWDQVIQGGGNLCYFADSMVQTVDGGYALVGIAGNEEPYGGWPINDLLVKTDSAGNEIWSQSYFVNYASYYGGYTTSWGESLIQTHDGGYAMISFSSELIKTDPSGNMLWNQTYGLITSTKPRAPSVTLYSPSIDGLTVTINGTAQATASGATISSISWNWGDGKTTNGFFPQVHTYAEAGTYAVNATVKDSEGLSGSTSETATVTTSGNPMPSAASAPAYAFNGAYANYQVSTSALGTTETGEADYKLSGVDSVSGTFNISSSYGGYLSELQMIGSTSSASLSDPSPLPAVSQSDLTLLSEGQPPSSMPEGTISKGVSITVPAGTFSCYEVTITGSTGESGTAWIDSASGLLIEATGAAGTILVSGLPSSTIVLQSTNISTGGSSMIIVIGVIAAVAIIAALVLLMFRKRLKTKPTSPLPSPPDSSARAIIYFSCKGS